MFIGRLSLSIQGDRCQDPSQVRDLRMLKPFKNDALYIEHTHVCLFKKKFWQLTMPNIT